MNQRFAQSFVVVAAIVGIACVDMSAPKGAASISTLQLPSPYVVVGDTMRDSLGVARPITLLAYDADGNSIQPENTQIFVTDTLKVAHLTTTSTLVGDKIGLARLLGQVDGLQTAGVSVPVILRPEKILAGTRPDTLRPNVGGDSATSLAFSAVNAVVRSVEDSASQGVIVRFTITKPPTPSPNATGAVAFLSSTDQLLAVSRDTTGSTGVATVRLYVNARNLDPSVAISGRLDSAVVNAEAFHNGKALAGNPVRIVVYIKTR